MQKFTIVLMLAVAAMAAAKPSATADKPSMYTDRYDTIDVKEITGNKRLLTPYVNCVLDLGKCSPEGKELKEHIAEALENNCENCSTKQRSGARTVIGHLINHEPEYWTALKAKYDPEDKYVTKYEDELTEVKDAGKDKPAKN